MDAWSGDQLKKMQLGGNDALNTFLAKYSVDKFTEIKEKYNSHAAEVRASRCHGDQFPLGIVFSECIVFSPGSSVSPMLSVRHGRLNKSRDVPCSTTGRR